MLGKNLNNLCKTIKGLKMDDYCVSLGWKLKLMDKHRISILMVETMDGTPVFGKASETMQVDISDILKLKVDPSLDYTVDIEDGSYILDGKTKEYRFDLIESMESPNHKIPDCPNERVDNFDIDAFKDFMKSVKSYADHIGIVNDTKGHLRAVATEIGSEFRAMVGTMHTGEPVSSKYPVDVLAGMVSMMIKDTTLSFNTDYPAMFEWTDGVFAYKYIIAPRIECN